MDKEQNMIKVKLLYEDKRKDERDVFFLSGVRKCSDLISIVENEEEADFVFCHRGDPTVGWRPPVLKDQNKLVIVDYSDPSGNVNFDNYGFYFKRSVVNRTETSNSLISKLDDDNFFALPFSIKYIGDKDVHEVFNLNQTDKPIDVSCFFRPHQTGIRATISRKVQEYCKSNNLNCHIGVSGNGHESYNGRENFIKGYYDIMNKSKIIVNCNPNNWEGDWRLYESLSVGSCVFVDKMLIPMENPLVDGIHVINYDLHSIKEKLDLYLTNEGLREEMCLVSKDYVYNYHTPENRIKYIINKITQ